MELRDNKFNSPYTEGSYITLIKELMQISATLFKYLDQINLQHIIIASKNIIIQVYSFGESASEIEIQLNQNVLPG